MIVHELRTADVLARYDALRALVDGTRQRPPADPALSAEVSVLLAAEARALDAGAYEQWLSWWAPDGVLWVPVDPGSHPARDQSLLLDDVRRLHERVAWRRDPAAWGQQPASTTVRNLGPVEAWLDGDASDGSVIVARSALLIVELRRGRQQVLAGHQVHELVGPERRLRSKVLLLPLLTVGVHNPSFLL